MLKISAGILVFRVNGKKVEILIGHTGGPYGVNKDTSAWSIPKGEIEQLDNDTVEDSFEAAIREFKEETNLEIKDKNKIKYFDTIHQSSMKDVIIYIMEENYDLSNFKSNTFEMEWPEGSGNIGTFPEIDKLEWVDLRTARDRLFRGQRQIIDLLQLYLEGRRDAIDSATCN